MGRNWFPRNVPSLSHRNLWMESISTASSNGSVLKGPVELRLPLLKLATIDASVTQHETQLHSRATRFLLGFCCCVPGKLVNSVDKRFVLTILPCLLFTFGSNSAPLE